MTHRRQAQLFVLVVVAELLALAAIIGKRELLLRKGERVLLRCRPIDPRSLLSGDYVELRYLISELSAAQTEKLNRFKEPFRPGDTVYLALTRDAGQPAHQPVALSHRREPLRGLGVLLRGQVREGSSWRETGGLRIRYGVESYFVPQGQGLALEQQLSDAVVEVAVSTSSGEGAIRRLLIKGKELRFY